MIGGLVVLWTAAACLGGGALALAAFGLWRDLPAGPRVAYGLPLGFGLLGIAVFPLGVAGLLTASAMAALLAAGSAGLWLWRQPAPAAKVAPAVRGRGDWPWIGLVSFLLLTIGGLYLLVAAQPPTDGDSMAYHFANVRLFAEAGRVQFIPRAADGATPMTVQMTYLPPYILGGERAMTLWSAATLGGLGIQIVVFLRRAVPVAWALAGAGVLLTLPVTVYGGSSGQVEMKNAMFVLGAAFAVAEAARDGDRRHALLAGLLAGLFVGSKYLGLQFAAAAGLVLILQRRWLTSGAVYVSGVIITGISWYIWNFAHTGDPVFPVLFDLLELPDHAFWTADVHANFEERFAIEERRVPASLVWLVLYPFRVVFDPLPLFEAGRTGPGPVFALLLPFAFLGLVRFRKDAAVGDLWRALAVGVLFYALWFLIPSSQRFRHMAPVLPLVGVVFTATAWLWFDRLGRVRILVLAAAVTLGFQMAIQGGFSLPYLRHALSGESRDAFLDRMIPEYPVVRWINGHLSADDRGATQLRHALYHLRVPYLYVQPDFQALVDVRAATGDVDRFLAQLRAQGVTHLIATPHEPGPGYTGMAASLVADGTAVAVADFDTPVMISRTLGRNPEAPPARYQVLRLRDPGAPRP